MLPPQIASFADVTYYEDMPSIDDSGVLSYFDVGTVALNLEFLSRDLFTSVDQSTDGNSDYGIAIRKAVIRLTDAAEYYNDAVASSSDYSDTLYDLFYLDAALTRVERTLDGSQSGLVQDQMGAMRSYVNELLYSYRRQY
jgi:hypothetical protein